MEGLQNASYSRNNYFFGKLMTVRDFEGEQEYLNGKRCLGNRCLTGAGIVAGLDVVLVDGRTLSIESGVAIDYKGREIIVPTPVVKKLDSIEGFKEKQDKGTLYLCVKYHESLDETSFSIVGSGKDGSVNDEFNRVKEDYKFFITDKKPDEKVLGFDSLLVDDFLLYDKMGVKLTLKVPRFVNPGKLLKVSVVLEKENVQEPVSYKFSLKGDLFKSLDGQKITEISYTESEVNPYKVDVNNFFLLCDAVTDANTEISVLSEGFSINIGGEFNKIDEDFKFQTNVNVKDLSNVIIDDYYSKAYDDMFGFKSGQEIYLAKLRIVSNQSTYFIEDLKKHPFNQYVLNNEMLNILVKSAYLNISPDNSRVSFKSLDDGTGKTQGLQGPSFKVNDYIKSGVEKIDVGLYAKSGKICYSSEFVHGAGEGDVGLVLSLESKNHFGTDQPSALVFGDTSIFKTEEFSLNVPKVTLAGFVNPDKGTLKIGVRLQEKISDRYINVRWWVFKNDGEDKAADSNEDLDGSNVKVSITPNTVEVKPLEKVRLAANVSGSICQSVKWSLAEKGTGTINQNGLYTAPAKSGVYEVVATSTKHVDKSDSAYVVVSDE